MTPTPARVQKGEPVSLSAEVLDQEFKGINDGRITARDHVAVGQDRRRAHGVDGRARRRVSRALHAGRRRPLQGQRRRPDGKGEDVGRGTASLRVAPSDDEYFDAAMRAPLLSAWRTKPKAASTARRTCRSCPKRSPTAARASPWSKSASCGTCPIMLVMLLGLMGGEWLYRRRRGLA